MQTTTKQTIVSSVSPRNQHWKDRAAGWQTHSVTGPCPECGKPSRITIEGTKEGTQRCIDENRALCNKCENP